ncbi:MAG: hypothetical protein WD380_00800, partial [Gaiellaceae bacterium]
MILEGFRAVPFRVRVALALSSVALVVALVGALGPAERVRTTYSWPPATLPEETPSSNWYTPLLLVRHQPESISARIPCSRGPALPGAAQPTTVLATARYPERTEALAVTVSGNRLVIGVGRRILAVGNAGRDRHPRVDCSRAGCDGGPMTTRIIIAGGGTGGHVFP